MRLEKVACPIFSKLDIMLVCCYSKSIHLNIRHSSFAGLRTQNEFAYSKCVVRTRARACAFSPQCNLFSGVQLVWNTVTRLRPPIFASSSTKRLFCYETCTFLFPLLTFISHTRISTLGQDCSSKCIRQSKYTYIYNMLVYIRTHIGVCTRASS